MTIHVVQPGQSVYSISKLYQVPMERIISDNELTHPERLAIGQALVIRYPNSYHIVEPGQTLTSIAAMYGTSINRLFQLNPSLGGMPQVIPGQVLIVSLTEPILGSLAVNGYVYPNIDRSILRKTLPYLSYMSVFSYGFNPETGELLQQEDAEIVKLARSYRAAPILVLTTIDAAGTFSSQRAHDLLNNPTAQDTLLEQLATAMKAKDYAGMDIDFEYIPPEDTVKYAEFVQKATDFMNAQNFTVMVSLAPKTSSNQPGLLYEAHDYHALGAAANNALLMTYEWGFSRSAPMAVAPLGKVREVVQYAVSEIPPQKLFMGIPNYGYDWVLPHIAGVSVARSMGNVEAVDQAVSENAEILYDWTAQSPNYEYWRAQRQHEVWFEDARSIRAKLGLATSFGLRGVSIWSLMRYFPQLWLVLSAQYAIEKTAVNSGNHT